MKMGKVKSNGKNSDEKTSPGAGASMGTTLVELLPLTLGRKGLDIEV